jgi:hypothetical protein
VSTRALPERQLRLGLVDVRLLSITGPPLEEHVRERDSPLHIGSL